MFDPAKEFLTIRFLTGDPPKLIEELISAERILKFPVIVREEALD
jgi:hypothetical protein